MSKHEHVVAVKSREQKQGFSQIPEYLSIGDIWEPKDIMLGSREWLETDENFHQLIPYCVVTAGTKVLAYARTPKGGENRLQGKVSVGFGGHINANDVATRGGGISLGKTIMTAVYRELEEELWLPVDVDFPFESEVKGLIYDGSNPVGRVHLGILIECRLDEDLRHLAHKITTEDEGITILGMFDPVYLLESDEVDLEPWSRYALEGLA